MQKKAAIRGSRRKAAALRGLRRLEWLRRRVPPTTKVVAEKWIGAFRTATSPARAARTLSPFGRRLLLRSYTEHRRERRHASIVKKNYYELHSPSQARLSPLGSMAKLMMEEVLRVKGKQQQDVKPWQQTIARLQKSSGPDQDGDMDLDQLKFRGLKRQMGLAGEDLHAVVEDPRRARALIARTRAAARGSRASPTDRLIMEAAGVAEQAEHIEEELSAGGVESVLRGVRRDKGMYREKYEREIRAKDGTPLYFTKKNVSDAFGKFEERKCDVFERLELGLSKAQLREMNNTGYALLSTDQLDLVYGPKSPYNNSEALRRFVRMNASDIHTGLEKDVHALAELESFRIRQKDVVLSPILFTNFILTFSVKNPIILSPILFSSLILSPNVLGPVILSPWVFVPVILSPRVLAPTILSPFLFDPIVLSPFVLHPVILSPGAFNPIVLNPFVLSPFILSPQAFTPVILSPIALSPFILNPSMGSPLILSPYVLTPSILSPHHLQRRVLNNALNPRKATGESANKKGAGGSLLGPKPRDPKCARCSAHGEQSALRGHKKALCPFLECACAKCALVEQRRRLMADQIKLRRQQKKARIQTHHHQLNKEMGHNFLKSQKA
uniref:DM domain-containing protein n=1 Tax=Globodera pallida TaxID=36090 RepID=A0A183C2V0_GLOPA